MIGLKVNEDVCVDFSGLIYAAGGLDLFSILCIYLDSQGLAITFAVASAGVFLVWFFAGRAHAAKASIKTLPASVQTVITEVDIDLSVPVAQEPLPAKPKNPYLGAGFMDRRFKALDLSRFENKQEQG